jgi:hypothetical protein
MKHANDTPAYCRLDFRSQDHILWDRHDILIKHNKVCLLPGNQRPDAVFGEGSVCCIVSHSFEGLRPRKLLLREPEHGWVSGDMILGRGSVVPATRSMRG